MSSRTDRSDEYRTFNVFLRLRRMGISVNSVVRYFNGGMLQDGRAVVDFVLQEEHRAFTATSTVGHRRHGRFRATGPSDDSQPYGSAESGASPGSTVRS